MGESTDEIISPFANGQEPFLTDLVKDDQVTKKGKKSKRVNWDIQKGFSVRVSGILATGQNTHQKQAERIQSCANTLEFGWIGHELKFKAAYFCKVRNCPVCQWRRSKMWIAKFFQAFPRIYADYPKMRYILLTLTVENCPVSELRDTVKTMNHSWNKLIQYKAFPALGFVRCLEVTKETDTYDKKTKKLIRKGRPDYAHPHFHILLAVPRSYFGGNYLSTAEWVKLWKKALRADYEPICDVRIVKPKPVENDVNNEAKAALNGLMAAIVEVIKYTVKPTDMVQSSSWLLELVNQMANSRAISLGGIFKQYLNDDDVNVDDDAKESLENYGGLYFGWREALKRYRYNAKKE